MSSQPELRIRPTHFWSVIAGLLVLTLIFIAFAVATWRDVDPSWAWAAILALWGIVAGRLVWRMRSVHVSVVDGRLDWLVPDRWAKGDEPVANVDRLVLASKGDLEIDFTSARPPLRLTARSEFRPEDLKALAHLLATGSGRTPVEVDGLPKISLK